MRYTVELNAEDLAAAAAESTLRKLLADVRVARVFGEGRYASIDVTSEQLDALRRKISKHVTFQKAVAAHVY